MKTATFTLNNKELLLVELPDIEDCDPVLVNESELFINGVYHALPLRVKLIGKLPEVTENQYEALVNSSIYTGLSAHYVKGINPPNTYCYRTAKESFFSKLDSEGIAFENPLLDPGQTLRRNGSVYYGASDEEFEEYTKFEEKVFNIDNTFLFEKV